MVTVPFMNPNRLSPTGGSPAAFALSVSDGLPRLVIVSGSPLRSISSSNAMHFALNSVMPTILPIAAPFEPTISNGRFVKVRQ